ncbi:GTPase HflX [Falsihalocynthiibacter sp. SS001]|uniref:GTPase HflX n=1 Tax=Falsihalocynthiibacter sp. SS001 TaxID=3349698 RepID=UPI0036D3E9ED
MGEEYPEKPDTPVWVLHPDLRSDRLRRDPKFALEEAVSLAEAMPETNVVGATVVPVPKARAGWLFGSGKTEELKQLIKSAEVDLVLIDGALTPVQQRNLEKEWGVKILDRTGLILEIFSDRARTREGVLQVEVAALSYQRTRLVRAWTHLERQRGGLGFVGGPGETQIEADRRAIDERIQGLQRQLSKVVKTRALHRQARARVPFPVVALVGYTNAGKSTLFNRLTGAEVFAKDMLFATLDPTMRSVELPSGKQIILSDTVGFISELPTQLVAAFRATLEEVLDADLILHVRDISHPLTEQQANDVNSIMADLGVPKETPIIEVWNKIDLLDEGDKEGIIARAEREDTIFATSSITGEGMEELLDAVSEALTDPKTRRDLVLPFSDGKKRAWLFSEGLVENETQGEDGFHLSVYWTARQEKNFRDM